MGEVFESSNNLGFSMALTNDTVLLFLLLMPGFLSSTILNSLIVRKAPGGIALIIEALVFSFVIYACWGLISGHFLFTIGVPDGTIQWEFSRWSLFWITVLSLVLPLVLGALITHDCFFRILGYVGITRRTGRASVWLDVFVEKQKCVIVNFKDGRQLFGWPEFYSDDVNEGMLYLTSPRWLDYDHQRYVSLGMPGFLIVDRSNIESIMFTDISYNNAEFETYGEKSITAANDNREGTEHLTGYERPQSAPESTDQTTSATSAPTTKKELARGGQLKD